MNCTHNPKKKNQVGEFVLEVDSGELSILSMGSVYLAHALKTGLSIPIFGKFPNDMDRESRCEMRTLANHVVVEIEILSDSILNNERR